MAYTGKKPVDFVDVTQSQSMTVSDDLTVNNDTTVAGDLTVDTNTLYVDSTNNRVGIGTTSPVGDGLHIKVPDAGTGLVLSGTTSTAGTEVRLSALNEAASGWHNLNIGSNETIFRTAGTERMRIDSSGRVGVGTTSPATNSKLHVNDPSNTFTYTKYTNSTTGTGNADGLTVGISSANALIYNYESGNIQFATAGTERMRIASTGATSFYGNVNLTVGTYLTLAQNTANANLYQYQNYPDTVSRYQTIFYRGANFVGSIQSSSTATGYYTTSDYRLKENVVTITDGIERLKQLKPSRFNFISTPEKTVDGFLAHEAGAVVPEAITGEKDGMRDEEYEVTPAVLDDDGNVITEAVMGTRTVPEYQQIDEAKIVPLLTAALQEAIAKIETLEEKVAALENA